MSVHEKMRTQHNEIPQNQIHDVVQFTLDTISDALANGNSIELRNFGIFDVQLRKKRIGRNPNDPKKDIVIPEHMVARFKPGKGLKEKLKALDRNIGK